MSLTHTQLDAFVTSGPSPTFPGIHLVGPGQVGRELLTLLAGANLVAVSDSTGTIRGRLDAAAVRAHKQVAPIAALPGAVAQPLHVALDEVGAPVVCLLLPSDDAGRRRSTPLGLGASPPAPGRATRVPRPATPAPSASPPTTSDSQCAPVCRRE